MKNIQFITIVLLSFTLLPGCEFIGDVFKAGMWVGILIIVAVIAVIAFIVKIFSKK